MVELKYKRKVRREDNDENKPMYVAIPDEIVEAYGFHDGDVVEWSFTINCKNQKVLTLTYEYKGF
ncbi:MAG: hypothetical protein IJJ47_06435 [Methanosphaera sp.]|nr:hypothetical protein [Methanosphaera sp.]